MRRIIFIFVLFLVASSEPLRCPGKLMIIDHDGGADDAMAIFLTLLYQRYFDGPRLIGITTSHGNVNENQVYKNTQRILDIAGRRDVPIYRGSNYSLVLTHPSDSYFGYDGLGDMEDVQFTPVTAQPHHAVNMLIEMSKMLEGDLIVVAIGPVTNIALAIRLDPHFISRLNHLYVAAGNVYSEKVQNPEFNALIDVEGYHVVAEAATPDKVTFIPFSPFYAAHNISIDWRLNTLGAIDTEIMRNQNKFERISNANATTWNELDPLALAMVLNKDLIKESICTDNGIILCGDDRGINTNNFIDDCSKTNARIAFPAPEDKFQNFLYDVFSAELN